jgi:2-polyprenyl-3-methyl-5-hydroxy-6-metoxy-1,4-benzoquinol methylase
MSTAIAGVTGEAPVVAIENVRPLEKDLYKKVWEIPEYRKEAPGEKISHEFLAQAKPKAGSSVIDFGCGTGRGALNLAFFGNMDVTMVDFAPNCLDADIVPMLKTQKHTLRFIEADLSEPLPVKAAYGYCTDVMEHIRPHHVDRVLSNCLSSAQHVFFQISTVEDKAGELVGHKLHLTVRPFKWWLKKLKEHNCVIHWSKKTKGGCLFYVTAWVGGGDIVDIGVVNVNEEQIKKNVAYNIKQGFLQVQPYPTNNIETMIIGGGPSLLQHIEKIKQLRANGVKLIAINGAYKWCLDNGITPSAMVMVDARKFNARFTQPVVKDCKYFIASQCHPSVFKELPKDRTYVWHTQSEILTEILEAQFEEWYPVPGGSTVLLRAIPLFRMLGFKRFHIFGCDSCLEEDAHHAYEQIENDDELVIPVNVSGKIFNCHPWMVSQAQEFIDLIRMIGDEIELEVYGGLLHHILESGASMADIKEI